MAPGRLWLAMAVLLFWAGMTEAQVFQVQGGDSTLFGGYGGRIGFQGPGYEGWTGAGVLDGTLRTGAFLQTEMRGYKLRMGDDSMRLAMPTDVFDGGNGLATRGLGIEKTIQNLKVMAFAGADAVNYGSSFFQGGTADTPMGALYLDERLSSKVHLFSRNIFSTSQTSINSLSFDLSKWLNTAVAAGIGSGQGYFSTSLLADRGWMSVKAEFVKAGDHFRRFVMQPFSAEVDGANIMATFRPKPGFSFGGVHENIFQALSKENVVSHGSVNNLFANGSLMGVRLSGSLYESEVAGHTGLGLNLNGGYRISSRIDAGAGYFTSRSDHNPWAGSMTGTVREVITSRLRLLQVVTHSAGQTNVSFGGDLTMQRLSIGVDYQTLYLPFVGAGGGFKQMLVLNLRVRPWGQLELAGNTVSTADGKLRYTATAGDYLYRYRGLEGGGGTPGPMVISDHVIRGIVLDDAGQGVAGAALHIQSVVAYTDKEGKFLVRVNKGKSYPFQVALEEFVTPLLYEVVSAPAEVKPESENTAPEIKVILRRVAHRKSATEISKTAPVAQ